MIKYLLGTISGLKQTNKNSKRKLIFLEIKNQKKKKITVNYLESNDDRKKEQNVCSKEGPKASACFSC